MVDKLVFLGPCHLCSFMISLIYLKKSQSFYFVDSVLRVKIMKSMALNMAVLAVFKLCDGL